MTEIKIGEALSYTLPLESVDLTYLSRYVQNPRDEIKPLWSKKHLDGESGYYQIQIVAQDINPDDCYSEPSDTYKCHVCNLDVPKTCLKEHNESKIHETYKNIFTKVLERVSKQIEVGVTTNDGDINKDAYYCITCSKIVKIKNKYRHEASSYHIETQENVKILSSFYEIFNDDEKEIISELNKENENNDVDKNEKALTSKKQNLKNDIANNSSRHIMTNSNDILDSDDDVSMESEAIDTNDETKGETNKKPESSEKETSLEEKLTKIIAKYKLNFDLVPVIDGEFIRISTPHGKGRVSHENFHSYRPLKDSTYCQMCKMWISKDTKAHEATEIHLVNILKPVNEKFGRTIDTISSHCIVCNEVVLTLSDHHTKENHRKILIDQKIGNNSQNNRIVENGKTLCEICNISIDTHNFAVHLGSKKHKQKIQMKNVFLKNLIAKIGNNEYYCSICNLLLEENTVNDHINELSHIVNKLLDDPNSEYCEICNVKVSKGEFYKHKVGKTHLEISTAKLNNDKMKAKIDSTAGMQNGNASVKNTMAKNQSIASTDSDKVDDYYKLFVYTDDTKTKIKCTICDVNVPHNDRNVVEHVEGKSHIDISNNQKMGGYHKLLMFTDDAKTQIKCRICDVNIPFVKKNIMEHMEGKRHDDKENKLLDIHKIVKSTSQYFCKCCDVDFTKFKLIDHINTKTHTNKLQEKYVINKDLMREFVYENDTNDDEAPYIRDLYDNLLISNSISKVNNTKFYCKMCDTHLGRINEIDHMLGERHGSVKRKLII